MYPQKHSFRGSALSSQYRSRSRQCNHKLISWQLLECLNTAHAVNHVITSRYHYIKEHSGRMPPLMQQAPYFDLQSFFNKSLSTSANLLNSKCVHASSLRSLEVEVVLSADTSHVSRMVCIFKAFNLRISISWSASPVIRTT